jgi:hypothetical protein
MWWTSPATLPGPRLRATSPHATPALSQKLSKLLALASSESPQSQLKAAHDLCALVGEGGWRSQPASFGPLCHALAHLLPSSDRLVATYAARAMKLMLRFRAIAAPAASSGVPEALTDALMLWSDDLPASRELLGAIQELCGSGSSAAAAVAGGVLEPVLDMIDVKDSVAQCLAIACAANLLAFCDSVFASDDVFISAVLDVCPELVEAARGHSSRTRRTRLLACAAIANACAHPQLMERLKELNALQAVREAQGSMALSALLDGVATADCAVAAMGALKGNSSGGGDIENGEADDPQRHKFIFHATQQFEATRNDRWCMDSPHRIVCGVLVWVAIVLLLLSHSLFSFGVA